MLLNLGGELRRARESRRLSLRDVATSVGVSPSLLSQVETGKTLPSVSTLYALVNYLGLSLDGLLRDPEHDAHPPFTSSWTSTTTQESADRLTDGVVQRREDNPELEMENGVTWERLAAGGSTLADPLLVTYPARASSSVEGKMMRHGGVEYGILLEGRLTLRVDFESYDLKPGDSFCFDSARPHAYVNRCDSPAKGIWFVIGRREVGERAMPDSWGGRGTLVPLSSIADDLQQAVKRLRPEATA